MSKVRVVACRAAAIFDDPSGAELIAEYAAACAVPEQIGTDPQREMYAAMEQAGSLQCFAAYLEDRLIGFVSVLSSVMPHHGKRIATIESIFVLASCRPRGAWDALEAAAKEYAEQQGCVALLYTVRVGSAFETVLSRTWGCERTHTVFTRWLA